MPLAFNKSEGSWWWPSSVAFLDFKLDFLCVKTKEYASLFGPLVGVLFKRSVVARCRQFLTEELPQVMLLSIGFLAGASFCPWAKIFPKARPDSHYVGVLIFV